MRCNQCGAELLENAKFCAGCGSPAGASPTPPGAPSTGVVPPSVSSPTSLQQPAIQNAPPMSAYPAPAAQPQVPGQLPSSQAQPAPAYVPPPTTGYGQQAPPLQSKRPKKAVKIVAIVAGILLLSCIGVAVFAALINAGYIPGSITDGDSAKMPYEVTAYGHDYTVSGYVVYDNADGDTTVGLSMEDFQGIPLSGGRLQIPLDCYIIDTEGKEYGYSSLTAGQGLLAFTFDGSIDADKIVLMAADDDSTRAEFPANKES